MSNLLQHLRKLESDLHHPGVPCSRARLEQMLHPDFWEIGASGRRYERDMVINVLEAQQLPPAVAASNYAVTMLNDGSALLTYHSARVGQDGVLIHPTHRSSIWQYTDGRWQLLYHQGTPAFEQG